MWTPHFLKQKTPDFSKFMVCPQRQRGGFEPVRTRGRGLIFRDFVQTSFKTVPYGYLGTGNSSLEIAYQNPIRYSDYRLS